MDNPNPLIIIDEDEFETSELIELHKELIRLIEKDIDTAKAGKFGLTHWTIFAAIGAVAAVLFGMGKQLIGVNFQLAVLMFLAITFFTQLIMWLIGYVNPETIFVKEKRLYNFRDRFSGTFLFFLFRFCFLIFAFYLIYIFWDFSPFKVISFVALFLIELLFGIQLFSFIKNIVAGNNPAFRTPTIIWSVLTTLCYLSLFISSLSYLKTPDENDLISYSVGAIGAVFVFLVELLLSFYSTSPMIFDLNNLRDDIIFRRVGLNEALLTYRRIKEGSLFFEMVKDDYDNLYSKMDARDVHLENLKAISKEIIQIIPSKEDLEETRKRKVSQLQVFSNSLNLAFEKEDLLNKDISFEFDKFIKKTQVLANRSGDKESKELIDSIFISKDQKYYEEKQKLFNELTEANNLLNAANTEQPKTLNQ